MKANLLSGAICILFIACSVAGSSMTPLHREDPSTISVQHNRDSIVVRKQSSNRRYKIRLYPDANHEVLFFTVSGDAKRNYQLYLFDVDGALVKQANIKEKQVTLINRIPKGSYLFEIFSNDERLERGLVTVM